MRIIREFPFSDRIKASLFSWNGKYILKLESGGLEQTYKIAEMELSGLDELLDYCQNELFRDAVNQAFACMESAWPPES